MYFHGVISHQIDPHGGPIELFLIPASALHLVKQRSCYVLSYLWDGVYKRTLTAN